MFCTGKEQLTCNSEKLGCEGCFYFNDENEIKVGDYARTKQGKIIQISRVDKQQHYTYIYGDNSFYHIHLNDIVKHSKNVIDLVKVRRLCEWRTSRKNRNRIRLGIRNNNNNRIYNKRRRY